MRLKFDYDEINSDDVGTTLKAIANSYEQEFNLHMSCINVYVTLKNEQEEIGYPVNKDNHDIEYIIRDKPYKKSKLIPLLLEHGDKILYVYKK